MHLHVWTLHARYAPLSPVWRKPPSDRFLSMTSCQDHADFRSQGVGLGLTIQQDCADLRRTKAHLSQGTRPSRKQTKIRDAKRYLQVASIARDGLIVVSRDEPFAPSRELIVVPRQVVPGPTVTVNSGAPSSS